MKKLTGYCLAIDSRFQLLILGVLCALLWRIEVGMRGWNGLIWIDYIHFAIPIGFILCLGWLWGLLTELSNRRKLVFLGLLSFFGVGILILLQNALFYSHPGRSFGGFPYWVVIQALLVVLWISIPASTFAIYRIFIPFGRQDAIVGCVIFWFSWAIALLLLAITPGPSNTDLVHTLKSGLIIPPIIFALGWPIVNREFGQRERK